MTTDALRPVLAELDLWAAAGRSAPLWLRDDDATHPTPALDRLLDLTARHGVPLTLAVIPEPTGPDLAAHLLDAPHAEVAVHGWGHRNHAPQGQKSCELGPDRPAPDVLADLARGLAKLGDLHGPRLVPVLVPPWNRIAPGLIAHLRGLGYRGLSTFGPEAADTPLPRINTHVDLIDWRGTRGGRPVAALAGELAARLAHLRGTGQPGVAGFLTHHLDHDEPAWAAADAILSATAAHPGARWVTLRDALAAVRP